MFRQVLNEGVQNMERSPIPKNTLFRGLRPGEHPFSLRRAMEKFEHGYIHNVLVLNNRDILKTAEMLEITPAQLRAKMRKHGML